MQCLYICLYKYARWWFQRVYTFTPARRNFACNYILIFSIGFKPAISVFDLTTRKRHYFCVVCSFLHSRPPTKSRSNPALILLAGLHDVFIVMSLTLSLYLYIYLNIHVYIELGFYVPVTIISDCMMLSTLVSRDHPPWITLPSPKNKQQKPLKKMLGRLSPFPFGSFSSLFRGETFLTSGM